MSFLGLCNAHLAGVVVITGACCCERQPHISEKIWSFSFHPLNVRNDGQFSVLLTLPQLFIYALQKMVSWTIFFNQFSIWGAGG